MTVGDVGALLMMGGAFTAPWTGLYVGPVQVADVLWAVAAPLVLFDAFASRRRMWLPWVVVWLALTVLALLVTHAFAPADASHVRYRSVALATESDLAVSGKWLVALFVLPALFCLMPEPRKWVPRLVVAWTLGVAASAAVALTDLAGFSHISAGLLGQVDFSGRQAGLTLHANTLAVSCALAAPVALWVMARHRLPGGCLLALLAAGALTSGSRGGQVGFVLGLLLASGLVRGAWRPLKWAVFATGALVAVFRRQIGEDLRDYLRFNSGTGALASDRERTLIARQAWQDAQERPLDGVGLQHLTEAHSIYLQLLAAGGILLLGVMAVYWVTTLRYGLTAGGPLLGRYLAVSVLTWLVVGLVENQLLERWMYVPVAAIMALVAAQAPGTDGEIGADVESVGGSGVAGRHRT